MTNTQTRPSSAADGVVTAIGVLAVLGVVGSAVMAVAHFGVRIPVLDVEPGLILPAAIGFVVGTALYALVAYGVFTRASWAWATGLVVNALAFVSAVMPWRGPVSAVAGAVSLAAILLLVSKPARRALLYRS